MPERGDPSSGSEEATAARDIRGATNGPLRLGVLVSGSGTNLQVIMDACAASVIDASVAVVVSDDPDAYGLERARTAGVPAVAVVRTAYADPRSFNGALLRALRDHGVELVVMAGYMRLLGREVLDAFPDAVLNIHPALLPSFPGAHGIADAFQYGAKVTGVTVHFANEVFDEGPIIGQRPVEVREDDTLGTLEARIHEVEYGLYTQAIGWYADGRLSIEGRRVRVRPIE